MQERATSTISAVLVDDESPALDELQFLLKSFPEIEVIGTARNGVDAVEVIGSLDPDLVFLDVQMPGLDGLGVIRKLQEREGPLPAFVLCTAYEQYAVDAFRHEALDYLLKPIDRDRLTVTMERMHRAMGESAGAPVSVQIGGFGAGSGSAAMRTKLLVKSGGRNWIVDAADLIWATIHDGLITVTTTSIEGQTNYKTIEELQSNLDPALFWRVHRSYLVNINRIKEVIPWFKSSFQIRMDDRQQTEIPVSRVQTKRLRELFKL